MVNFRSVSAIFVALTVIFGAAAGYLAANPTTVVSTHVVTSTQPGSVTTSTRLSTVTNLVTQTVTSASASFTVKLAYKPGVGFYLTNATGWTLYLFTRDNQTAGTSACTGACIAAWPAFYTSNMTLPPGFDQNDFKLVPRADGIKQLAYYGSPLYYYAKDKAPGDMVGQGVGKVWFACCSVPATTSTTTTSSSSSAAAGAAPVTIVSGAGGDQASPGYSPATITLVRGVNATVTWTNQDSVSHTVTSLTVPAGAQSFASGNLIAGATFTVTFTVPGTYTYHCDYHSWMMGTIVVK